jgi:O-antigen ligase
VLRVHIPLVILALVVAVSLYALAVLDLVPGLESMMAPITELTGKNSTLTGRTQIWAILADHIRRHPLLGTGYGAYWTATPVVGTDSYEFIRITSSFYPGSAHNGYVEVVNDLGWVGLACLLGYLSAFARQSIRLFKIDRNQGALYLALFFFQALTNISETHWFSVLSVDFVLMTLATAALARGLLECRLYAVFGNPSSAGGELVGGTAGRPWEVRGSRTS